MAQVLGVTGVVAGKVSDMSSNPANALGYAMAKPVPRLWRNFRNGEGAEPVVAVVGIWTVRRVRSVGRDGRLYGR